jgi:hypothetical protein
MKKSGLLITASLSTFACIFTTVDAASIASIISSLRAFPSPQSNTPYRREKFQPAKASTITLFLAISYIATTLRTRL